MISAVVWESTITVSAAPDEVLLALTEPDVIRRWSPVAFDIEEEGCPRLAAGSVARVSGRLAGIGVGFDVEIIDADTDRLSLVASGPVELDAEYLVEPGAGGSTVRVAVDVRGGRGLSGGVTVRAVRALLAGGVLHRALRDIGAAAESLSEEMALAV